jgi:hypothetical protein
MSDGEKLKDFLFQLTRDDKFLGRYVRDAKGVMVEYGLSSEAIAAVLAGDIAAIRKLLGTVRGPSPTSVHVAPISP